MIAGQTRADRSQEPPARMQLLEAFELGELRLPNRILLTAMVTRLSGEDGYVNDPIVDRYRRFARGEAGLIVVEATAVHRARSGPLLRLGEDRFIEGHRRLVDAVHAAGPSKVALQIIHFLKISRSGWRQTVSMLAPEDIEAIPGLYARAAVRARQAGYDAVELHMAHAYTLSSFLSRRNGRHDAYGGQSLESRLRLPGEVLLAVRAAVGEDYPIGIRFDAEECIKDGYGLTESRLIALRLAQLGADYLSLSAGGKFEDALPVEGEPLYPYTGYSGDRTMPAAQYPDAPNAYLARGLRHFLRAQGHPTPVVAAGKIPTPEVAERLLAAGDADLIGLARALLADPDWPRKLRIGRQDRIVRCVYGNVCKALDERFREVRCVLWPKGARHAPDPGPEGISTPGWPEDAALEARLRPNGGVALRWPAAEGAAGVYGYEIQRRVNRGDFEHLTNAPGRHHVDRLALAGNRYAYRLRAYDFAGRRSAAGPEAEIEVPVGFRSAEPLDPHMLAERIALDGRALSEDGAAIDTAEIDPADDDAAVDDAAVDDAAVDDAAVVGTSPREPIATRKAATGEAE